ncbi:MULTISPECIES: hypothetical protein [Streptomyces]|uniref:Uncharacterized protein n=1 Tax=Streptomyces eurythermus TaxID=42237 RepID=A0ABW6Z5I6_9ACTN|nr:hypothetical protein [Streptomyces sp. DSM 40868]QIS72349.1 hypothetical protein HB370_22160 [Streptomyces sp. DSM 40868]
MSTHLHALWLRAIESAQGDNPFDHLRRASLQAAAEDFGLFDEIQEVPTVTVREPVAIQVWLSDSRARNGEVAALEAGDFLKRIQRAVARLAKARRARLADVVRLSQVDFDVARLNVASASVGSWVVDLKYPEIDENSRLPDASTLWAEIGVVELVRALPEDDTDERSIDSINAASPVIRRAVADLISDRPEMQPGLSISVRRRSGEVLKSTITPQQASSLREKLAVVREERGVVRFHGRLDGLRTRRQIFYLELEGGREIHGYVDESLMPAVKNNLDREVEVELETFVLRARSGKSSQRQYRLIRVGEEQTQLPVGIELTE